MALIDRVGELTQAPTRLRIAARSLEEKQDETGIAKELEEPIGSILRGAAELGVRRPLAGGGAGAASAPPVEALAKRGTSEVAATA